MSPRFIQPFRRDESGAVTVDWVVLTAGLIIFGVMVAASIIAGSTGLSGSVGARLTEADVPQLDFNADD
jgi:Flp pilus assembly pilin Flp